MKKLNLLCRNLFLADIGLRGLQDAQATFPYATTVNNSADNLKDIPNDIIDLYLSFRTYNSSFFLIKDAIKEMSRILKSDGSFILSLPNGYLNSDGTITEGLLIPKTDIVDPKYVYQIVKEIEQYALEEGFQQVVTTESFHEIFVYSTKNKSLNLVPKGKI